MAASTITTQVEVLEVKVQTQSAFGPRYAWQAGEIYAVSVNVKAQTIDGDIIYFNSPSVEMRVTSGGGIAVVTYEKSNDFVQTPDAYCVESGKPAAGGSPSSKLAVGQVITIKGRIKKEYSNGAKALNYVKMI